MCELNLLLLQGVYLLSSPKQRILAGRQEKLGEEALSKGCQLFHLLKLIAVMNAYF